MHIESDNLLALDNTRPFLVGEKVYISDELQSFYQFADGGSGCRLNTTDDLQRASGSYVTIRERYVYDPIDRGFISTSQLLEKPDCEENRFMFYLYKAEELRHGSYICDGMIGKDMFDSIEDVNEILLLL